VKRPTIADIARRAGVTKAAVSFALNDQPGVSTVTRERIMRIARDLGWQPNSAARALSDGRAGALGLVVDRPAGFLGVEPWFMQLIAGIQGVLAERQTPLLFTVAEHREAELELYRSWWARRRVDGVFLVDLRVDDPRPGALRELGLPGVVVGDPDGAGGLAAVWTDDAAGARLAVRHLAGLGHRRIARVTGMEDLWHTRARTREFLDVAGKAGIEADCVPADYTAAGGAEATHRLLTGANPPTAIVYDNDLMAVSGLGAAHRLGLDVPGDLSIVAWDDSVLCSLVHPALTALTHDVLGYGAHAARVLLGVLEAPQSPGGASAQGAETAVSEGEPAPLLTARASTGPAAR
jgi:DNA-binding LacI/PurR family transcriptional regulator